MAKQVFFAVDIETTGPKFSKNAIIAIGYCAGTLDGEILLKKCIKLELDGRSFDPECVKQFWSKYPTLLSDLQTNPMSVKDGLTEFVNDLDTLNSTYQVIIISDNPSYDLGFLNYYLDCYLDRYPLNYIKGDGGLYRPVFDTDAYTRGLMKMDYTSLWTSDSAVRSQLGFEIPSTVIHDHHPENDAEYIYQQHRLTISKVK
jgi:hypothetical protein